MDELEPQQSRPSPSELIRHTYARLREWYQENARELLDSARADSKRAEAIRKSLRAIDALPPACELTDLEVRVALFEVTSGILNWSYWDRAGDRFVYELVASTLQAAGYPKELAEAERKDFRASESKLRGLFPNL